jgi:hypothetical protein
MTPDQRWVHWWYTAWRQAEEEWCPPALRFLDKSRLDALARSRHAALGRSFGITPCTPPRPKPAVQSMICGDPRVRSLTYALVDAICAPVSSRAILAQEQRQWCQSIAKSLRPGHWLGDGADSLVLLRAWLGDAAWERVRLQFPRSRILALEDHPLPLPQPPASRLDTLWQSAYWKAEQCLLKEAPMPSENIHARKTHA